MAYRLSKYIGQYRILSEIDQNTNDFPRNENGKVEETDLYIKCSKGKIYHFGRDIFVVYCDSIGKSRNILKKIGKEIGISLDKYFYKNEKNENVYDTEGFYSELLDTKIIFDIEETDSEVLWKFKEKDLELMADVVGASTYGAGIRPFSPKNLPKREYIIIDTDLDQYKELTKTIPQDERLEIAKLTKTFITTVISKSKKFKGKDINKVMKKEMLKGKEFIHSCGFWKEYIKYLKKNINNKGEN